jgi:hypothetical protein
MARKSSLLKSQSSDSLSDTEAWNIAQFFTIYSIAVPLKDMNELEMVARFGSAKIQTDIPLSLSEKSLRREDALKRYWQLLFQLVSDTLFKAKKHHKNKAEELYKYLQTVPKYFDKLTKEITDEVTHEEIVVINERLFDALLNDLVDRKHKYISVLNQAGLIFRESDTINLEDITREFIQGG